MKKFAKCECEQKFGKKIIENMLPTKVCVFHELSETILLFGLCYLNLDLGLIRFLQRYLCLHVQFCPYLFQGKIAPQFWKTGLPLQSQQTRCLVFLSDVSKLFWMIVNDYSNQRKLLSVILLS